MLSSIHMKKRPKSSPNGGGLRATTSSAFTLVELLVALGLVSLLMLMFAQVFTIATGTMTTQRGVMENDQRARTLTTIITHDLKHRSMRSVMPFFPGEDGSLYSRYYSFANRQGYLSISENDPLNDADDVLSFTTDLSGSAAEPYYGKATAIGSVTANPNQPEADDAQVYANSIGTSNVAEIVYFVRNGNLYRRVLLIRNPLDDSYDRQPRDSGGNDFFNPATSGAYTTGSFWNDFDFSARYDPDPDGDGMGPGYLQFAGSGVSGTPNVTLLNDGGGGVYAIGMPVNRFGHDYVTGNPREYVFDTSGNANAEFIGRFTQEETSHSAFIYPRDIPAMGNPMDQNVNLTLNTSKTVSAFTASSSATASRRGEDILLSNVHGFDVKVWDELASGGAGDYVDIGGSSTIDFSTNALPAYGPKGSSGTNRVFDTWHRSLSNPPPYRPTYDDANNTNGAAPPNTSRNHTWTPGIVYKIGDVVIPPTPNGLAYEATAIVDNSTGASLNYAQSGASEPSTWNTTYGGATFDDNSTATITWTTIPTTKRLKSLKITIRYLDVTSDQMRQVTLIQSLLD
jgi:type II secretory pathway pseudopilin PulG